MEQNQYNPEVNTPQNNEYQQGGQGYNPNPQFQQPQYNNYQQQPANNMVKPDSGLVWAILTTLFCCLPFGIVAIVKASQVDTFWGAGRYQDAQNAAKSARTWSIVSAAIGVVGILIYIVYIVVLVAVLDEVDYNYNDYLY